MKVIELRIGNLVYHSSGNVIDVDIIDLGIEEDGLQPIPLKEDWVKDWLIDNRFHKDMDSNLYTNIGDDCFLMLENGVINLYTDDDVLITSVKYVHQLQNLFYALKGKDLKTNNLHLYK
jgi:hypothetical protein